MEHCFAQVPGNILAVPDDQRKQVAAALPNVPASALIPPQRASWPLAFDRQAATPGLVENRYAPLIVTAQLPAPLQNWANELRQAHFPPERNHLSAHVTLFHALPASVLDEARDLLSRMAAQYAAVDARLSAVMDLGGGTAIRIESSGMLELRDQLAEHFHGMLSQQDSHVPRLHVTIQNKVERKEAQALQRAMHSGFEPREFRFAGLALHRYLGGPWDAAGQWSFRGNARL